MLFLTPHIQQTHGKSMINWEEDFINHPVHTTVQNVKEKLDSFSVGEDTNLIDLFSRLVQMIDYIDMCLKHTNPALVLKGPLDQINANVGKIPAQLDAYISNKNTGHLTHVNNYGEAAVTQCINLPQPSSKTNKSFSKIVSDSYESSKKFISEIIAAKNTFEKDLESLNKHTEGLEEKIQKQEQTIEDHKIRLDSTISDFQKQFSEAEAKRSQQSLDKTDKQTEAFSSLLGKFSEENEEIQEVLTESFTKFLNESKSSAESTINVLNKKKQEASDLVGVIGNIGVTGNFKIIANEEQKTADRYRRIALSFMGLMVVMVGYIVLSLGDTVNWLTFLTKIAIVAILYIPVQYATKESDRHRKNEHKKRRLELELASIDPFLENLPTEKRNNLKAELAQRFFAQPDQETSSDSISPNALLDILKSAVENLTKIK